MSETYIGWANGALTEELLQEVLEEVDDATLDEIEITRANAKTHGLAGEPVTAAVVIAGSTAVLVALLRILERKMEHDRQFRQMKMISEAHDKDPKLAKALTALSDKHSDVSIAYGLSKESWLNQQSG